MIVIPLYNSLKLLLTSCSFLALTRPVFSLTCVLLNLRPPGTAGMTAIEHRTLIKPHLITP